MAIIKWDMLALVQIVGEAVCMSNNANMPENIDMQLFFLKLWIE